MANPAETSPQLDTLASYDPALAQRIFDVEDGKAVNGHHPNGTLSNALANEEGAHENFVTEYRWLLALEAFPFRQQEDKTSLMLAAEDALFTAGETYDPLKEPNFVAHSSKVIGNYLEEIFGEPQCPRPDDATILAGIALPEPVEAPACSPTMPPITPENTTYVESTKELPALPNQRTATDFSEGQKLLVLWNGELHAATVKSATAYDSPMEFRALPIFPEDPIGQEELARCEARKEELAKREALYERRLAEICDNPTAKEAHYLMPDPELLRIRISMQPEFQALVPSNKPGFLRLSFAAEPAGVIMDMHYNRIIPEDAFKQIKRDPQFLEAWLASGSPEDKREEHLLVDALKDWSHFPTSDKDVYPTAPDTPRMIRRTRQKGVYSGVNGTVLG